MRQRELPALLTPAEVCAALRISHQTFYRMVDRGDLEAIRLGGREGSTIRIRADALKELVSGDGAAACSSTSQGTARERPPAAGARQVGRSTHTRPKETTRS